MVAVTCRESSGAPDILEYNENSKRPSSQRFWAGHGISSTWKLDEQSAERTTPRYMYHGGHEGRTKDNPRRVKTEVEGVTADSTDQTRDQPRSLKAQWRAETGAERHTVREEGSEEMTATRERISMLGLCKTEARLIYKPGLGSRGRARPDSGKQRDSSKTGKERWLTSISLLLAVRR